MAKDPILKELENVKKDIMKDARKDFVKAVNKTNREIFNEVNKMYDSVIDAFYSYKTTSYIRHGETQPGTKMGNSLYRGNNFKIKQGLKPMLFLDFNPNILNNEDTPYQYDSDNQVFDYVMFGIRFPYYDTMSWRTKYSGKYFKFSGTPRQMFEDFDGQFDSIAEKVFNVYWKDYGWY